MKSGKFLSLIILMSALLIIAINPAVPSVKAQTQDSLYVYTSCGGTISSNGTSLTGGTSYNYTNGAAVSFTAIPDTGLRFLCWEYASSASGASVSTDNPFVYTISQTECSIQAMFVPAVNTSVSSSSTQTGTAPFDVPISIGGTTVPAAGTYTNYTIGTVVNFVAKPSVGFKFLYWMVPAASGDAVSIVTSSQLAFNVNANACALQAFFVPTSSNVTLPAIKTVDEFSSATSIIIALALAVVAFGTYAYKRNKK